MVDLVMESFRIRLATTADTEIIAWHRARMFQDMGDIPPELFESFRARSRDKIQLMLESGEYLGWLASPDDDDIIVAGAGVQLRDVMPHPGTDPNGKATIAEGRHAMMVNVFTEPEWRRRGLAALLIKRIIEWSLENHLDRLILHAAENARPLYERLGFTATNEMEFVGESSSSPNP
jgi:GNAT superfamily N-acetyltransferase